MKSFAIIWTVVAFQTYSQAAFVDPNYKLVEWTGWGTTMHYWSDLLGGMSQNIQEEITFHMFSPKKLNLNVLRYNIGGTIPGDETCGPFHPGAATESFQDGLDRAYNWTRDPRSRKILLAAKALGADTFEAGSRSPPSWMTRSGCSLGNQEGGPLHDNFDPKYANAFANYLTVVVQYYHEHHNITFASLAPIFEPSSGNWQGEGPGNVTEGCNMERSTAAEIIKSADASLEAKGISFCRISAAHELQIDQELITQRYFDDAGVTPLYNKISLRYYTSSMPVIASELYSLASKHNHAIWIDGKQWLTSGAGLPNITQGLSLAREITFDLRNLNPSAWVYWDTMRFEPTRAGLLNLPSPDATLDDLRLNSGYYAMMQFSQYIRKGCTLVHVSDMDSVAAYDQSSKILVIVTINPGLSETSKDFDLNPFSYIGNVHAFRTSSYEPHAPIRGPNVTGKNFTFQFPAESITTFKVYDAVFSPKDNLIGNGDFESGKSDPWYLQYGVRDDNGVNDNFSRRGTYGGNMDLTESKLELVQSVNVNTEGTYHLSAWCSTTGPSTRLGVLVNGLQGPEINIEPGKGYQLYGLSFEAKPTDLLSIYFHSEKGNHTAQIDEVAIY